MHFFLKKNPRALSLFLWALLPGALTHASPSIQEATPTAALPELEIPSNQISISGLSSGAFLAVQLGIVYSSQIHGVGSFSGGIYNCAENKVDQAKDLCMKRPKDIDVDHFVGSLVGLASANDIDNVDNLAEQKIYIFHGQADTAVLPESSNKLNDFYTKLKATVKIEKSIASGHGFPSVRGTVKCDLQYVPWMNKCNFDGAEELFKHFYGPLLVASAEDKTQKNLLHFNQSEFITPETMMLPDAWAYIPDFCQKNSNQCRLHIALHGCLQNPQMVQDAFIRGSGLNEWADSNHIVVLYPSVGSSGQENPMGCWDWWGYTGSNYANKKGPQIKAIKAMMDRLTK